MNKVLLIAPERNTMDILYVGNEINGSFISEISKKDKITYSGTYTRVADYENIIFSSSYEVIMFDVDNLIDEAEIITEYFVRAKNAKNATIIIVAIGYSYQSLLIEKLLNAGFKNFILATSLAKQYEEYSKCLEGYYEENGIDIKEAEEPQQIIRQKVKTIGIAGTIPRIGTTTTSLQLVKYIESKGYNAAYVEINTLKYIEQCEKLYADVKRDNNKSYLKYNGIRMYVSSNMGEVMSDDYNYIICDYGAVVDPSFNKVSFLEKDLNIFVAGTKANEIECVQPLLQSPIYREAKYIFNFTPENDKEDIKDMMMDKKDDTYFNVLVADPFDYIHNPEYERLLPLGEAKENNTEKKKLGFLARLRK